jgi:tRNA A-37 threonylcarbamoyl transferase component Bud32
MMPDALRARLGTALGGGYTVEREIVGGGMSRVYVAEETALRRHIVVKVLSPELAADVSIARFQREIALAARLQHPHIVPLVAFGEMDGLPFYTMPYVAGESLRERLERDGALPVVEATRLLREVATALAYAHEQGIVHRDIKPANVLLSNGIALVTDFGVAKALVASATAVHGLLTSAGIAIGTPAYMAPEQVSADPAVDHRADLYSFGMLAYEMLTGRPPFAERMPQELLAAHLVQTPTPLDTADVPQPLADLVMRCLEKRPADRPEDAKEIVRALDALATPVRTPSLRFPWRRRTRAMLAAAATLVIVTGGAWAAYNHHVRATAAASRLLIVPFENLTGDASFDNVGRIAADQLGNAVSQQTAVEAPPTTDVLQALGNTRHPTAEQTRRLAVVMHAALIVSGTIVRRGDSLYLEANVSEASTGKLTHTLAAMTPTSDAIPGVTVLADRLIGALGVREFSLLPRRGFRAPTSAAEQEFHKGFEVFAVKGDNYGSRPYFARAITLDSTFTLAYLLLARQYLNVGEWAPADTLLRHLEHLPLRLSASERLHIDFMRAQLKGDFEAQLRVEQQIVSRDSSPVPLQLLGRVAVDMMRPNIAVPALELALPGYQVMGGSALIVHQFQLTDAYHEAGMYDRELRTALELRTAAPRAAMNRQLRAYAGLAKREAALALADSMLRGSNDSLGVSLGPVSEGAHELRVHGDPETAARLLAMCRDWIRMHSAGASQTGRRVAEAVIFLESGLPDSAAMRFAGLPSASFTRLDVVAYNAMVQAARGDRARARAIADSLGAVRSPWLFGVYVYWQAAITGAIGEKARAVELLKQAHREGFTMRKWHSYTELDSLRGYPAFEELIHPKR